MIAALQEPYQFFLSQAVREVGHGWITNRRPSESIRLHHDMVLDEAGGQLGIPPKRRLLVGFSQAVALNDRLASTYPDAVRGVIAICGGLPGDWDTGAYQPIRAPLLHIASREDEYYPVEKTGAYPEVLRRHAAEVEFQLIDGGHRMPGSASGIVMPWLRRILS